MDQRDKLNRIFELVKSELEAGAEYICRRTQGKWSSFNKYVDGIPDMEVPDALDIPDMRNKMPGLDESLDDILSSITNESKPGSLTIFTLTNETGFTYKVADAADLLQMIKQDATDFLDEGVKKEIFVRIKNPGNETPEFEVLTRMHEPNGIREFSGTTITEYPKLLYSTLDKNLESLYVVADSVNAEIQTVPEIPGLTKLYRPAPEDLTIDASNLDEIYAFLESFSDKKIEKAIEILAENPELKTKAENRYLNLIKNRLGGDAGLESFAKAALTREEVELLKGNHFDKNFISLSYFDKKECQLVVDFLGGLVMNHLDIADYQLRAEATDDEKALFDLYSDKSYDVKAAIVEEAKNYADGWFSKLSTKFANLRVEKVMFEKTHFKLTNSNQLKAFLFYVNLNFGGSVYFDVFQSYLTELTEFYWFAPRIPKTAWGDTDMAIAASTLKFAREMAYKIGDDGDWIYVKSDKLT